MQIPFCSLVSQSLSRFTNLGYRTETIKSFFPKDFPCSTKRRFPAYLKSDDKVASDGNDIDRKAKKTALKARFGQITVLHLLSRAEQKESKKIAVDLR